MVCSPSTPQAQLLHCHLSIHFWGVVAGLGAGPVLNVGAFVAPPSLTECAGNV